MSTPLRKNLFFYSLLFFCIALSFSIALISVAGVLTLVSAFLSADYKKPKVPLRDRKYLLAVTGVYLLTIVGLIACRDIRVGVYDLKKALPFLLVPLSFTIGPKLKERQFLILLELFSITVFLSALITFIKFQIGEQIALLDAQYVGFIHHIRFSLMILVVFLIQVYLHTKRWQQCSFYKRAFIITSNLFLLFFLFWQQSLTGIITLGVVGFLWLLRSINRNESKRTTLWLSSLLFAILAMPFGYIGKVTFDFYNTDKVRIGELPVQTARGNNYIHDLKNTFTENGHYIGLYLCEEELREEWNKRSIFKYDELDENSNRIKDTLIRYLTSLNLPKDAMGLNALSDSDVKNIEAGISNYLLAGKRFSLYPRIYVSIWELDRYFKTGNSNNKSIAQRIEYAKAAWSIWKDNFWLGVGPGNWKQAYHDAYKAMDSKMDENQYADAHNQYLAWLVRFGLIGTLFILFTLAWPVIKFGAYKSQYILVFLLILAISNLGDSNLDTHAGGYFFLFFYCLFLVNREYLLPNTNNELIAP